MKDPKIFPFPALISSSIGFFIFLIFIKVLKDKRQTDAQSIPHIQSSVKGRTPKDEL